MLNLSILIILILVSFYFIYDTIINKFYGFTILYLCWLVFVFCFIFYGRFNMNNVLVGMGVVAIFIFVSIFIWRTLHDISIKILCYLNKNYVSRYNAFDGRVIYDEIKDKRINKYKEFLLILVVDILIVASIVPVFYLIGCVVNG